MRAPRNSPQVRVRAVAEADAARVAAMQSREEELEAMLSQAQVGRRGGGRGERVRVVERVVERGVEREVAKRAVGERMAVERVVGKG